MSSRSDGGSEPDGRIFGRDMGMLCASRFFFFSGHNAILVMLAPFLVGRGADPAQAGLAVGAAGVVSIASRLIAGWWSDQHGRKPILLIGAMITAAVAFSYGYVQSYNSVLALRMLEGIAGGAFLTTTWTLAAMLTPSGRRGEAFGLFTVVSSMAIGAAPLIAIFLESRWGFRAVFSVASLCFILALVCVVILRDRPTVPLPTGAAASYKGMLRPGVLIPSLAGASAMFVHGGVQAFLILFAAQRGIVHAGLFFTIYSLIGLCSRVFVGRAGDRFGIRTVTLPSLFILSVGLFLLGTARSLPALVFAAVIYGLGFAAVNPLVAAMVAGAVRDSEKGAALGFQGAGKDVGIALGGPLLGLLIAPLGYGGTFLTAGLIMVGVALGMSVLLPRRDPSGRVDPGSGHAVGS